MGKIPVRDISVDFKQIHSYKRKQIIIICAIDGICANVLKFFATGTLPVCYYVSLRLCWDEFKLRTLHVEIEVRRVSHLHDIHFQSVVSPGAELQLTHLVIKREVSYVYITTAA